MTIKEKEAATTTTAKWLKDMLADGKEEIIVERGKVYLTISRYMLQHSLPLYDNHLNPGWVYSSLGLHTYDTMLKDTAHHTHLPAKQNIPPHTLPFSKPQTDKKIFKNRTPQHLRCVTIRLSDSQILQATRWNLQSVGFENMVSEPSGSLIPPDGEKRRAALPLSQHARFLFPRKERAYQGVYRGVGVK